MKRRSFIQLLGLTSFLPSMALAERKPFYTDHAETFDHELSTVHPMDAVTLPANPVAGQTRKTVRHLGNGNYHQKHVYDGKEWLLMYQSK